MGRLVTLLICTSLILLPGGCGSSHLMHRGIEVHIDGDGRFPPNIVGTWKANHGGWVIVFEPDGYISSATISLARVKIIPGKTTMIPMIGGGTGTFVPGKWRVQYLQQHRQLLVNIVIESFYAELGRDIVLGKMEDILVGKVSEDGTIWRAERYNYPKYLIDTDQYKNYQLPIELDESPIDTIIFRKDTAD